MNTPYDIVDVSEADFELEVLNYSQRVPVIVDFWAEWCGPCKTLGPLLEKLASEAQGDFRLAKVNVDENPNLARQYGVRSIPTVKAFRDGRIVGEFVGAQPEGRVREFTRQLSPSEADLTLDKANSLLDQQRWAEAEQAYRQVLTEQPGQPMALSGLIRSLLAQGHGQEALFLMEDFPASKEYAAMERLRPLGEALIQIGTASFPAGDRDELEAAYGQCLRLVGRGNLLAAIDGLLDLLRQDKRYRAGEVHRVLLAAFELLGERNELTRRYRSELATILF